MKRFCLALVLLALLGGGGVLHRGADAAKQHRPGIIDPKAQAQALHAYKQKMQECECPSSLRCSCSAPPNDSPNARLYAALCRTSP